MIDEALARRWCEALARTLTVQHIPRNETPYLERYFAAGWNPQTKRSGPAIFLHHFVSSDDVQQVHSHPWGWSLSLILVGGYREERCSLEGTRTTAQYHPGDVNILAPEDKHRIDLLGADCWTLFLAGSYLQPWQFMPMCEG